jgi:hypothetical protein
MEVMKEMITGLTIPSPVGLPFIPFRAVLTSQPSRHPVIE